MTDMIDSIRSAKSYAVQPQEEVAQRQQQGKATEKIADRVSLGESSESEATYGPGLKVGSNYDMLRQLVITTLEDQGINLQISTGDGEIDLTEITPDEAQELVSEDGYFGVDKTSQRIVDFAINSFGGDVDKLEEMRSAIDKGFKDAAEAFGGDLPEISQQTYEAIMDKLDAFAASVENTGE